MNSSISRQAVINAFDTHADELIVGGEENARNVLNYLNKVINTIKELPPAQPEQRWIPCSKRLPEEQGFYLVTVCAEYRPVRIYCFSPYGMHEDKKYWRNDCNDHSYVFNHFVEAWMPLPELYIKRRKN